MNEMNLVRDLLQEPPPPSGPAKAAAFRKLEDGMAEGALRRRAPMRLRFGLAGLIATGAAAAVAVSLIGGGEGAVSPTPQPTELNARGILLAAADHAAKEPTGRYWRLQRVGGQAYHVGPAKGGYSVLGYRDQWDHWKARSKDDPDVLYARDLGARPLTPADRTAWQKAGSPKKIRVWSNDHWADLSITPGKTFGGLPGTWNGERTTPADKRRGVKELAKICAAKPELAGKSRAGGKCDQRSPEELERLVNDPARVRELLFAPTPPGGQPLEAANDLMSGFDFLTERAVPPAVRAAAFRALAERPGVRSIGSVRDPQGRAGIGLAAPGTMQEGSGTVFDYQLILEPETYRILSGGKVVVRAGGSMRGMRPGDTLDQDVVLQAGWTNQTPTHP